MKKTVKSISKFIKEGLYFIYFLLKILKQVNFKNNLKNTYKGTVAVLANGPSLKSIVPKLATDNEFKDVDFIVLNFFAFDEIFFEIKPKHYCLADPMFFQDCNRREDVQRLFSILENQVNWKLHIHVPSYFYNTFIKFSKLKNSHLVIVENIDFEYKGFERFRHFFYKQGLAIPRIETVAILAIFIGLNSGYSQVNLYGVDHTFLDNLKINDENQLCSLATHFYDKDEPVLKPLLRNENDSIWKISDYLLSMGSLFKSHDQIGEYSKYLKVKILNCTTGSMIDSYERNTIK